MAQLGRATGSGPVGRRFKSCRPDASSCGEELKGCWIWHLNTWFGKRTTLSEGVHTIPVKNISERKKFVLGAFNAGEGRIADAQHLAEKAGRDPQLWEDVARHLPRETRQYVEMVPRYEAEFALKSPANKNVKKKEVRKGKYRCTVGHWRTIDDRPVFICA